MRYILEMDYDMQIKNEVMRLLTSSNFYISPKLVRAEQTAIAQLKQYIGKRYDLSALFLAEPDQFIVTLLIDIALYHLYSQSGSKDIPKHRDDRYQDALEWLKAVGTGTMTAHLPEIIDDTGNTPSDVKIWSARTPENHKW